MKLSNMIFSVALILTSAITSIQVNATLLDFDLTYDGTNLTLDLGSDTVLGSVLVDGDSFNYNISASGTDFWKVDLTAAFFPFLAFTVAEDGIREGSFSLNLLLDGVSQFSLLTPSVVNRFVHMGANSVSLVAGLMFDEIILDYTLISAVDGAAVPINTTIIDYVLGVETPGGFTSGISYNAGIAPPTNVSEPSTLIIFAFALIGLASRRLTLNSK